MRKEGAARQTIRPEIEFEQSCIDVTLAGIRIKIDYFEGSKTFFVAVGAADDRFSGQDGIPIGHLYDTLRPLARKGQP